MDSRSRASIAGSTFAVDGQYNLLPDEPESGVQRSVNKADVVIVGAGIVGLSIAWQLHRRGSRRIFVLEKGVGVGEGSTGASSAICRFRYTDERMIRLAREGIDSYRAWQDFVGLKAPRAVFHNDGVLWFTGSDRLWADREHTRLSALGIRTAVLDDAALLERFPAINPCTRDVDVGDPERHECGGSGRHLLELDGGYMDPVNAAQDLLEACRGAGIEVRFNAPVEEVHQVGGRVRGVALASGEEFATPCVVNAAGPWCNKLYHAAGLEPPMPLTPVRIQVVYLNRTPALQGDIPVVADMHCGIYFRTQNRGQQLLVSSVREEDESEVVADPDNYLRVADDIFRMEKLHLLQHRLPALGFDASIRDYCGLYTVNQADVHPVIGPLGPEGFYVANGFSGHGFKTAPAIGAMVARLVTGEVLADESTHDDTWLAPGREPIRIDSRSVLA
jgi:sarcosine oxidase subunit beta